MQGLRSDTAPARPRSWLGISSGRWGQGWPEVIAELAEPELDGLYDELQVILADGLSRDLALFPDGTIIETDWEQSLTVSDWES